MKSNLLAGFFDPNFYSQTPTPPPPPTPETLLQRAGRMARSAGMLVIENPDGTYALCLRGEVGWRWPDTGGVSIKEIIKVLRRRIMGEW